MINISELEPDQAGNSYITFTYCEGNEQFGHLIIQEPERTSIEIAELIVYQKYRNKGIATCLINKLIEWCSNYPLVKILTAYIAPIPPSGDVGVTADILKTFYEKQGFIVKPSGEFEDEFMGTLHLHR